MTKNHRIYELRTYTSNPGKLDNLINRFRIYTQYIFVKHGMQLEGFWVPIENEEQKIVYILSFPDQSSREISWKEMIADPEWVSIKAKSNIDGELVQVIQAMAMYPADLPAKGFPVADNRVVELRTYKSNPGNQPLLVELFRDHCLQLLENHGTTNIMYWEASGQEGGDQNLLICLLAHHSREEAKAAFKSFDEDGEIEGGVMSKFNRLLTASVRSVYLRPVDFSAPIVE
jgi:hypothetical protein